MVPSTQALRIRCSELLPNLEDFAFLIDYMKIRCIDIVKRFQIYRRVIKHKINPDLLTIF